MDKNNPQKRCFVILHLELTLCKFLTFYVLINAYLCAYSSVRLAEQKTEYDSVSVRLKNIERSPSERKHDSFKTSAECWWRRTESKNRCAYLKPRGKRRPLTPTVDVFFTFSLAGKDTFSINNRFMRWSEEERTWGGVQSFWLEIREEEWPIERITNERDSPHQRRACSDSV